MAIREKDKDKKKKFSLPSKKKLEARKLWEVFRNETEKRFTTEESGRDGSFGGPAGVAGEVHFEFILADEEEILDPIWRKRLKIYKFEKHHDDAEWLKIYVGTIKWLE